MVVVRYVVCKETVAVLRVLLEKAIKGEVRGIALCHRAPGGADEVLFTGAYRERPENAIGAALRMKWAASQSGDLRPPETEG